jgi:RNA polymerase sigma-70 factor, ECF subfamily
MEDAVLIGKLKAGDKTGFHELMHLYANRVINTCYKFLLDKEDAEDLSQEVFIEVFQSIRSFRGEAKLSTWIYRIAVTKSLDELKKRKRKKRITSIGAILHLDEISHWIAGGTMPDKSIGEKENMDEIMHALNQLPDSQRVAFTLSKIEGYTNPEIADIMKTTTIAVESLIYRAKKKIIVELEKVLKKKLK